MDSATPARDRDYTVWWFLAGAALVTVLFYRDFIFHPERLLFGSDMLFEGISLRRFYVDEILAGRGVPLWVPHVYGGMPFVAILPGPIFYPSTILYFLLPLHRAIGWTFVLHTFLSGAFGYFLGRSFRLRPASAAVCGASFLLAGYVTSHLFGGQDGRMFTMTLIPLALGLLNRGLERNEFRWFAGLAFVIAAQTFSAHVQMMYFSSLALAAFFVYHVAFRLPRPVSAAAPWRVYVRPVAWFTLANVAAVLVAAPQFFPTLTALEHVTRAAGERGYEFAASWALPPQELTAFFLPDLIGSLPGSYWGQNPIKLHTEYLGAVPLALAILGISAAFGRALDRDRRRVVWFLAGASVLGVLFALGAATPVHRIAYTLLPMMSSLRAPSMMLGPVTVFVALLAAYGWEAALNRRAAGGGTPDDETGRNAATGRWSWPVLLLGGPILLLGAWAVLSPQGLANFVLLSWYPDGWPRQPSTVSIDALRLNGLFLLAGFGLAWGAARGVARHSFATWTLVVVLAFGIMDLWRVDARYLRVQEADAALATDPVIEALYEDAEPGERVWAPSLAGPTPNYRPNQLAYYGVSSASGLQKFLLRPYARLVGGITPDEGLLWNPVVRQLLNVGYLITPGAQEGVESIAEAGGRHLYELSPELPYAYFPAGLEMVDDTAAAVARTLEISDPAGLTIVESRAGGQAPAAGQGSASLVRHEPDRVVLEVVADRAGLLAVSEIHHERWKAFLDGEEAVVWRVNTAFRGVEVPAGTHELTFEYRSAPFSLSTWISLLTIVGLTGGILISRRRRPRGSAA
ncbi:hypothetical protein [Candidatus Palauibacter polyketidifaciens]|uniref:hypothetical protein n=1 Tax=Candidatus Palauibacter polyketidifaciens TaxID=3056740 RepID=UPI00238877D7|nr:hypothetical protein [Candidatus Palauibacter polyketidifaciens]MDE2721382.1 hypothetical protein [Candidatus Palauibacter polyketidifaciens]